jgi:hypothetical protein
VSIPHLDAAACQAKRLRQGGGVLLHPANRGGRPRLKLIQFDRLVILLDARPRALPVRSDGDRLEPIPAVPGADRPRGSDGLARRRQFDATWERAGGLPETTNGAVYSYEATAPLSGGRPSRSRTRCKSCSAVKGFERKCRWRSNPGT